MNYRTVVVWSIVVAAIILTIDELGYYWWRQLNPGSHWSHLRGDYVPIVEYPPAPRTNGTLNNQWRRW